MKTISPLSFTAVTVNDHFWAPRVETNRTVTIPIEYRQCEETGRIDALLLSWKEGMPNKPHHFWDSDVAKWIEAASYSISTNYDKELDALLDIVIAKIATSQAPDGYFNSYYQTVAPENRWTNLRDMHELYCAGHLIEAAVAHFNATNKRTFLDVMCRYADHIAAVFGTSPGQKRGYCGHEEIELALVKLFRATNERKYLALSKYFIDERGRTPNYFEEEAKARGDDPNNRHRAHEREPYAYFQAHKSARGQDHVAGHSVRAMYLYCAMADIALEYGDAELRAACERLWEHLCTKNMYITGGIGSSRENEGFTFDYDLPNESAYAETCAAIGLIFWNHRLLQLTGDGKYADVMERALYNVVSAGVSLDGTRFFYDNKLAVLRTGNEYRRDGMAHTNDHHRSEWFGCSCCPTNVARLLASFGEYIYSFSDDAVYVHLYTQGACSFPSGATLTQKTEYPWDGGVSLSIGAETAKEFSLKLRIPGWCRSYTLAVNGEKASAQIPVQGYISIDRLWENGDTVTLTLAMPVERIFANPNVRQNTGKIAIMRGPVVYCLEEADNGAHLDAIAIPDASELSVVRSEILGGIAMIRMKGYQLENNDWGKTLYRNTAPKQKAIDITAVPYCVWDNRTKGGMAVWIHRT